MCHNLVVSQGNWPSGWLRGVIELAVLAIAAEGETYGYVLGTRLAEAGLGTIKGGTLYPILNRLEDSGALTAEWRQGDGGPGRKFYRMTDEGLARLSLERQQWLSFSGRVTSIINPEGHTK
ncbi:PadR family transcriptional regulator [Gordonia sp. zg691]|nr:PadR family transcriptional regulator [Gordonia jinghuaiqii]MBD0859965.1 PadR family transcriptional regulator [Gordonia jinghuaiqii]